MSVSGDAGSVSGRVGFYGDAGGVSGREGLSDGARRQRSRECGMHVPQQRGELRGEG